MPDLYVTIIVVLVILILFAIVVVMARALMYGRVPDTVEPVEGLPVDAALVAEHLATALRIPTISLGDRSQIAYCEFERLHAALEKMYPRLHASLQREVVNGYSLLYTWPGSAPELEAVMLCGHLDVVPPDPVTLDEWTHQPFSGDVTDGHIWGRGALDMKGTVIGVLEAVEALLKAGYQPERTLYLAFGHDEEIGGWDGANQIAALLAERGVRLAAAIDEGGSITRGIVAAVELPVAMIAVGEKGFASLELKVEGRPGHSSTPPPHTAIGVLARAITRLEATPMPATLRFAKMMFDSLGIFLPFPMRLAFANSRLLRGTLLKRLSNNPHGNAIVRTTMAATIVQGGIKDNVLPAQARAVVNCRILPGDTREKVVSHARRVIADEAVQIFLPAETSWEPVQVSALDSPVFANLSRTIRQVYPDVVIAPNLVSGATDVRHYRALTENLFRFSPLVIDPVLVKTIHGIDERVGMEDMERMVQFYAQLVKSWTSPEGVG